MADKRTTIYAGHYGSGKTNLAVNHALRLRKAGFEVSVADLDIVNPYFRTADSIDVFRANGIGFIASEFANTNLDIPSVPARAGSAFSDESRHYVVDLGGDDAGALALGRFAETIDIGKTDMFLVLNYYRPMTRTLEQALEMKRDIEASSRFKFTGVVNNSNLGVLTDAKALLDSVLFAQEVAKACGLPLVYTAAVDPVFTELEEKIENLIRIEIFGGASKFNV